MNLAAQAPTGSPPLSASDLERLTVPGAALPANCRPSPPGGMFSTNPSVVTDPRRLGIMHGLVFGMSPDLEKAIKAAGRTEAVNLVAESLAASAADVEAGYAASYQEQGGSPEIGVFALLMKKLPAEGASAAQPRSARIIKGPVAIFYWSDARPDAPDLGCLDVVRRHIESVDFR
jgi:hypothetical protein